MTVKLLWTGGWDSTFRLLQIVLLEKRRVQPYYIIDHGRSSLEIEMAVMDRIRSTLFKRYPYTRELLLETVFVDIDAIKQNDDITTSYKRLSIKSVLGIQYDWLARFCEQNKLNKMELSVEKVSGGSDVFNTLTDYFKTDSCELDEKFNITDKYVVFKYFSFPLIDIKKLAMKENARKNGFLDLMNLTWFCHTPIKGSPCGRCHPCLLVMQNGLGERIPLYRRLLYQWEICFGLKEYILKYPKIYQFLKKIKNLKLVEF